MQRQGYDMAVHWQLVFIVACLGLGIAIGATPFPSERRDKAERAAEDRICSELVAELRAGTISTVDYMTTRCPARLIPSGLDE